MEESGPRPPSPEPYIKEEARSPVRKNAETAITVVCWVVYLYLLLPAFTMVLWYLGVGSFYDQMIGERGYTDLFNLFRDGGMIVVAVILIQSGWSYYNYLWFKKRGERRGNRLMENRDDWHAQLLSCGVEELEEIRNTRRLVITAVESGYRITSPDTLMKPAIEKNSA